MPWVQPFLRQFGQPESDVVIPPLFVVLYILFGRFDLPCAGTAFSGTYLTLIIGDLVSATISGFSFTPWWSPFTWVGGAMLLDGLLLMPIFAAISVWLIKSMVQHGHSVSLMYGRRQWLQDQSRSSS